MLNISKRKITDSFKKENYQSYTIINSNTSKNVFRNLLIISSLIGLVILFLPWTQNIRAKGILTTLKPNQKPQMIQSIIGGRIEKWYVQDGDLVKKGDTIVFLSEVKDEYFDPELLQKTKEQLDFKENSAESYTNKVIALEEQIEALLKTKELKVKQANNKILQSKIKVETDSINFLVAQFNYTVAKEQLERYKELYKQGLKSLTDVENRNVSYQKALNEKSAVENKYFTSQSELINAKIEIITVEAQYKYEIAKAHSDKYTAESNVYETEMNISKMQNQFSNYSIRNDLYYIIAPQDGYVQSTQQTGIGQNVKPGEEIIKIIPSSFDFAVEMFVAPIDLPLLKNRQKVRIQFDGWPSIIFAGWPNASFGTYGGEIYAIDNFINENGLYRVLVAPDPHDNPWPKELRIGAGTNNLTLLNDVPIWYELWRKFNGFPPDYYTTHRAYNLDKKNEKND